LCFSNSRYRILRSRFRKYKSANRRARERGGF
jgi:hypothetical protein